MKILINESRNKYDHIAADQFYPDKFEGHTLCGTWVNASWTSREGDEEDYSGLCGRCWSKLQKIRNPPPPKVKKVRGQTVRESTQERAQGKLESWNRAVATG